VTIFNKNANIALVPAYPTCSSSSNETEELSQQETTRRKKNVLRRSVTFQSDDDVTKVMMIMRGRIFENRAGRDEGNIC